MSHWLRRRYRRLRFGEPIVVVSGLPRSGTSMTMNMLRAGGMTLVTDGIRTADEDNPKGYYEDERVKDLARTTDRSWLKSVRGRAIKIIAFLLQDLPQNNNYKILFMHRDLGEILASQSKMLARRGESTETDDTRMRELYLAHLDRVQFWIRHRACFETLELHYKDVLDDPGPQAARIREFLGGELRVDKMVQEVDERLYRNRVPTPGSGSLSRTSDSV